MITTGRGKPGKPEKGMHGALKAGKGHGVPKVTNKAKSAKGK